MYSQQLCLKGWDSPACLGHPPGSPPRLPGSPCALHPPPGLERDKFDNKTVSFEEHIKFEHNMWNYLYFIVLVRVKNKTDYTGPESYVAQMIKVRASGEWSGVRCLGTAVDTRGEAGREQSCSWSRLAARAA